MATTRRVKVPAVSLYNSKSEADAAIAQIAILQRQRIRIATGVQARIDKINEDARIRVEPFNDEIAQIVKELSLYAEGNRDELTNNRKTKTVKLTNGTLQWRLTPMAVTIRGIDDVLKRLKTIGLAQFIRTKESIDKEAMARERALAETVEGVTFGQNEEFVITPNATNLEIPTRLKTQK